MDRELLGPNHMSGKRILGFAFLITCSVASTFKLSAG